MRGLTGGLAEVHATGTTVREIIDDLDARYPGLKARLISAGGEDKLKPNIALVVDGINSKQGLRHALTDESEVHFVPAMSGGSVTPLPRKEDEIKANIDCPPASLTPPVPMTRGQRIRAVLMLVFAVAISILVIVITTQFSDALLAFGQLGLVGVFILSVVGNATVILPAPVFVVACAAGPLYGSLATGIVAGIGSAIGEMTGYMAGYGGTAVLPQGALYLRLHALMRRYGPLVIFVMAVLPNPLFDVGGLIAGALKMRPLIFLVATALGKSIRLGLIAFICTGGLPWLSGLIGLR